MKFEIIPENAQKPLKITYKFPEGLKIATYKISYITQKPMLFNVDITTENTQKSLKIAYKFCEELKIATNKISYIGLEDNAI